MSSLFYAKKERVVSQLGILGFTYLLIVFCANEGEIDPDGTKLNNFLQVVVSWAVVEKSELCVSGVQS